MRYLILGGSGFIGCNLITNLLKYPENKVLSFSRTDLEKSIYNRIKFKENFKEINGDFKNTDFSIYTKNIDVVIHLVSTTTPSSINHESDISDNVLPTLRLLNACVNNSVKKFVFISSGGTVYGRTDMIPIKEDHKTEPICSYGIQKLTIEKYIQLYSRDYQLDSKIIRLANPYGPYQEKSFGVGAITNFTLRCIAKEPITIYGDGEVVRDYIYIDDAIEGIINIIKSTSSRTLYNLGTGMGTSLNQVVEVLKKHFQYECSVLYINGRNVDVDYNVLDICEYSKISPNHKMLNLEEGLCRLISYLRSKDSDEIRNHKF